MSHRASLEPEGVGTERKQNTRGRSGKGGRGRGHGQSLRVRTTHEGQTPPRKEQLKKRTA